MLLGHIRRNALDPELTASVTARAVGMSVRSVHNLMRDTGQSFSEWVLDARVTHARRLLQSAGAGQRKIADIALACGFSDLSHFNRMFKARFGCWCDAACGYQRRNKSPRARVFTRNLHTRGQFGESGKISKELVRRASADCDCARLGKRRNLKRPRWRPGAGQSALPGMCRLSFGR